MSLFAQEQLTLFFPFTFTLFLQISKTLNDFTSSNAFSTTIANSWTKGAYAYPSSANGYVYFYGSNSSTYNPGRYIVTPRIAYSASDTMHFRAYTQNTLGFTVNVYWSASLASAKWTGWTSIDTINEYRKSIGKGPTNH